MRLSEIQFNLGGIITKEASLVFDRPTPTSDSIYIKNISNFKLFIQNISIFPFFQKEIDYLHNSELYSTTQDAISVDKRKGLSITDRAHYLLNAVEIFNRVLKSMDITKGNDDTSIFIKLPTSDDLKNLITNLSEFEKSISQIISNGTIQGELKIESWESGSFWVKLFLGSQSAVLLVGSIAWSAAVINKKYQEGNILEQQVRNLELKHESLQDLLDAQKKATQLLIKNEVEAIQSEHFGETMKDEKNPDPEQFERLKLATKTFANLIQKGSEIHPALMVPEKANNVFPDYKYLDTITSKIKQIAETITKGS